MIWTALRTNEVWRLRPTTINGVVAGSELALHRGIRAENSLNRGPADRLASSSISGAGGLRSHLFSHFLLHFLLGRFCHVRGNHPGITVRVDDRSAAITPKHVHNRTARSGPEFNSLRYHCVHVLGG